MKILRIDYWECTSDATLAKVFPGRLPEPTAGACRRDGDLDHPLFSSAYGEHARAADPSADELSYDVHPFDPERSAKSGTLSSAKAATAEQVKLMFEDYVAGIASVLRKEFGLAPAANP